MTRGATIALAVGVALLILIGLVAVQQQRNMELSETDRLLSGTAPVPGSEGASGETANEDTDALSEENGVVLSTNGGAEEADGSPSVDEPATARTISVTARQWAFDPGEIIVSEGERVRLVVTSIDVAHGLAIPAFNVSERLEPGEETVVEFVADKKGTFSFFCDVLCGSGHSAMRGTLVVE